MLWKSIYRKFKEYYNFSRLHDDDLDVRNASEKLWFEIGKQYEVENEEFLKDELNFDSPPPNFPNHGKIFYRFNINVLLNKTILYLLYRYWHLRI